MQYSEIYQYPTTQAAIRVKKSQCYHVPTAPLSPKFHISQSEADHDEDLQEFTSYPQVPVIETDIPLAISAPSTVNPTQLEDLMVDTAHPDETETTIADPEPVTPITAVSEMVPTIDEPAQNVAAPRRSGRSSKRPDYLKDYEC